MEFQTILANTILAFGVLLYLATSTYCVIVALIAHVTPQSTYLGKFIVHYGLFTTVLWGMVSVALLLRKIGMVLLS